MEVLQMRKKGDEFKLRVVPLGELYYSQKNIQPIFSYFLKLLTQGVAPTTAAFLLPRLFAKFFIHAMKGALWRMWLLFSSQAHSIHRHSADTVNKRSIVVVHFGSIVTIQKDKWQSGGPLNLLGNEILKGFFNMQIFVLSLKTCVIIGQWALNSSPWPNFLSMTQQRMCLGWFSHTFLLILLRSLCFVCGDVSFSS